MLGSMNCFCGCSSVIVAGVSGLSARRDGGGNDERKMCGMLATIQPWRFRSMTGDGICKRRKDCR